MQQRDTRRSDESSEVRWRNIVTDTRGVSEVLGAILVFALVLAVLVLMQVAAVPAANQQVEFEHDQATQEDLQDVRTAIIESVGSGGVEAATVRLGVRYPSRLFLLNPGPVAGTLRTNPGGSYGATDAEPLNLVERCGTGDLGTKHLTYQIDYNEYQGRSTSTVENTVVVQKYENSEAPLVKNGQVLVRGNTISIFVIKGNASYSRVTRESINFISGGTGTFKGRINKSWTLHVPTTLDASEWETNSNLLQSELDANPEPPAVTQDDRYVTGITEGAGSRVNIQFEGDKEYTIRCTVVGINEDPGTNPTDDVSDEPGEEFDINPNSTASLTLIDAEVINGTGQPAKKNRVVMTFKNQGGTKNVTSARINFFYGTKPGATDEPASAKIIDPSSSGLMLVKGGFEHIQPAIVFTPGEQDTITMDFFADTGGNTPYSPPNTDSFFVLKLQFDDGSDGTYFVEYVGHDPGGGGSGR